MSSKKLMAAAMASIMAVGSMSVVAFAEEGVDTWTIDGTKAGDKTFTEAAINPYFAVSLQDLPTSMTSNWSTIKNNTKNEDNNYNKELNLAVWEAYKKYEFKDFKGGKAMLEMKGTAVEWVPAKVVVQTAGKYYLADSGSVDGVEKVMVPKLKDDAVVVLTDPTGAKAGDITGQTTMKYKVAAKADVDAFAAGAAADTGFAAADGDAVTADTKVYADANGDLVFGETAAATNKVVTKSVEGKQTVDIAASFRDAAGTTTAPENTEWGKQTPTVQFNPSFEGLSDSVRLQTIDMEKSKITVDISGTVSGDTWTKYYLDSNKKPLWTITGTKDYTWTWESTAPGEFGGATGDANGLQLLVGYANQTGYAAPVPRTFKANPDVKEDNLDLTIPLKNDIFSTSSWLGFGDIVPPNMLKALNDGGTIEFEFSRELKGTEYFTGVMMFGVANGAVANNFSIEPTYGNGKTATVEIPAGLTYYKDEKNPWQSVGLGWNFSIQKLGQGIFGEEDATGTDKQVTDVKIVKMTFKTKGASVDDNNSGSGNNSGNNGGNTTSGNKDPNGNPPTGIALAVAPVVLAAGAVIAVSASKKRK